MAAGWHSMLAAALRCATSFELQLLEISFFRSDPPNCTAREGFAAVVVSHRITPLVEARS